VLSDADFTAQECSRPDNLDKGRIIRPLWRVAKKMAKSLARHHVVTGPDILARGPNNPPLPGESSKTAKDLVGVTQYRGRIIRPPSTSSENRLRTRIDVTQYRGRIFRLGCWIIRPPPFDGFRFLLRTRAGVNQMWGRIIRPGGRIIQPAG
jgi:hypothetical protein